MMGFAEPVIGPATSGRTRWLYPSYLLALHQDEGHFAEYGARRPLTTPRAAQRSTRRLGAAGWTGGVSIPPR